MKDEGPRTKSPPGSRDILALRSGSGSSFILHPSSFLVAVACALALGLGFSHLGGPSLWHDEAVQVMVAKSIAETGRPLLPSGEVHPVAPVYCAVLAAFIVLIGDAESVVRAPSVLFGALNVLLTFLVLRPLLGRAAAIVAAFGLALSPWSLAWSRQARFYALQQTLYLGAMWAAWRFASKDEAKKALAYSSLALVLYVLALGTALHSVIFVGTVAAYAFFMGVYEGRLKSRWTLMCAVLAMAGVLTLAVYALTLPLGDFKAVFVNSGIGPGLSSFYLAWLDGNLSRGYFLLAMLGFVLMCVREGRRGLFAALAFWAPIAALSCLLAYHRHRFMYFAYPFYVAAYAYAAVQLLRFAATARRSWGRAVLAAIIAVFGARVALSTYRLTRDTLDVARGADTTLATRHPQWRKPCLYVRDHLDAGTVVITTTYMPTLYYVGRDDTWFPSLHLCWEVWETGLEGLKTAEELGPYMAEHPKGYFLAEWFRFLHFDAFKEDRAFVDAHMTRIDEASTGDVYLYAWGLEGTEAPDS